MPRTSALFRYRDYILHNAWRDLQSRYAGTALGPLWNIAVPLLQIGVYTAVFTQVMAVRMPPELQGTAFALYLCTGFFPWLAFTECIVRGGDAFVQHAHLLRKLAIPEEVFVAQAALASTIGLGVSMSLVLVAALLFGQPPRVAWLAVPVVTLLFQAFGFGIGLAVSCVNAFFRDVAPFLPILMQVWMWSTPIVYTESILPEGFRAALVWNPAWPFVRSLHGLVLSGTLPDPKTWLVMAGWVALALACGGLLLSRTRAEIRDVI